MKTKNLIIGLLTVAVIVLSLLLYFEHSAKKKPNGFSGNKSTGFFKDKIYICIDTLVRGDGSQASLKEAMDVIDRFARRNPLERVRAFHMGLDHMQHMMDKINDYNSHVTVGSDSIVGIRFYRGRTTRKYVTSGGDVFAVRNKEDLIVLPTLADTNLHELKPDADVPIYWHLRPCPKLCKKK